MAVPDGKWAEYARVTRDAAALLGYRVDDRCLPDEKEPCGGTFGQHAMANLAVIKAVCDHQLLHLGAPPETVAVIYDGVLGEIRDPATCQLCRP